MEHLHRKNTAVIHVSNLLCHLTFHMNFVQHIIKNPSGILTVKEKNPPTFYFFKLVNIVLAFLSVSYTGITLSLMTTPVTLCTEKSIWKCMETSTLILSCSFKL